MLGPEHVKLGQPRIRAAFRNVATLGNRRATTTHDGGLGGAPACSRVGLGGGPSIDRVITRGSGVREAKANRVVRDRGLERFAAVSRRPFPYLLADRLGNRGGDG